MNFLALHVFNHLLNIWFNIKHLKKNFSKLNEIVKFNFEMKKNTNKFKMNIYQKKPSKRRPFQ
jgi:hypothetical protein